MGQKSPTNSAQISNPRTINYLLLSLLEETELSMRSHPGSAVPPFRLDRSPLVLGTIAASHTESLATISIKPSTSLSTGLIEVVELGDSRDLRHQRWTAIQVLHQITGMVRPATRAEQCVGSSLNPMLESLQKLVEQSFVVRNGLRGRKSTHTSV